MRKTARLVALATCALSLAPVQAAPKPPVPPVVIAVVESGGVNVLHSDYRTRDGRDPAFPPGMPKPLRVVLPASGTWEQRRAAVAEGPLGRLEADTLYHVAGTRLLVYAPPGTPPNRSVFTDASHPTGTTSSAGGLKHGTDPDALVVFVASATDGWDWVVGQPWIDLVSTSYFMTGTCDGIRQLKTIAEQGRIHFASGGNYQQVSSAFPPTGSPYAYRVGGVDRNGRPWTPLAHGGTETGEALPPSRLYETGELYSVPAAASNALDGSQAFGGTSAATPRTAGRAARLVRAARQVLRTPPGGPRNGALAYLGKGGVKPKSGPLADGRLTRDELIRLMHHVAVPSQPEVPGRYYVEGYGAFMDASSAAAMEVLMGRAPEPSRPDDDAAYDNTIALRHALFDRRCP